jgi:hypothetical protein
VDDSTTPVHVAALRTLALDIGPQRLYVSNGDASTVTEYGLAAKGNLPPVTSMTKLPYPPGAIAVSRSGEVYVVYGAVDAIAVYAPGTTDQPPVAVLFGPDT